MAQHLFYTIVSRARGLRYRVGHAHREYMLAWRLLLVLLLKQATQNCIWLCRAPRMNLIFPRTSHSVTVTIRVRNLPNPGRGRVFSEVSQSAQCLVHPRSPASPLTLLPGSLPCALRSPTLPFPLPMLCLYSDHPSPKVNLHVHTVTVRDLWDPSIFCPLAPDFLSLVKKKSQTKRILKGYIYLF